MPEPRRTGDRTVAQRQADHASLSRLSESLVPALVAKLNAGGLGELEVREGDWHVRLRRPPASVARKPERTRHATTQGPSAAASGHGAAAGHATVGSPSAAVDTSDDPREEPALSPAVGVFKPGAGVGTRVRAGDRIATVDLLGIAQDVVAPVDGTVVEVYPQPGDGVEYGEEVALVRADPDEPDDEPDTTDETGAAEVAAATDEPGAVEVVEVIEVVEVATATGEG